MNLQDVLKALSTIEGNGEALRSFLTTYINEKEADVTTAQGVADTAQKKLKTLAKTLGIDTEKLEEKIKDIVSEASQVSTLKSAENDLKTKLTEAQKETASLRRESSLRDFSATVGADFKVLNKLLPVELKIKVEEVETEGKKIPKGFVEVDGKSVEFADFVEQDENLKTFRASIFTTKENPPRTPAKLPAGKSPDTQPDAGETANQLVKARIDQKAEKVIARFTPSK